MRLDKYLKVTRLIKRRTVAKDVADAERILVNGRIAKPSTSLVLGDIIEIRLGNKLVTIKVTSINENPKKNEAELMYELIQESKIEQNF